MIYSAVYSQILPKPILVARKPGENSSRLDKVNNAILTASEVAIAIDFPQADRRPMGGLMLSAEFP